VTRTPSKKESQRVEAKAAPHTTSDRLLSALAANLARASDREPELIARLKAAAERLKAARRVAP
jgi:hypothetical protein